MNTFDRTYRHIVEGVIPPPAEAYFISPDGKAIPARDSVHINTILKFPEQFGITMDHIKKLHRQYKEDLNTEGKARNEIFLDILKKSWVRVRYYPRNQLIIFQIARMTDKVKENIWSFLEQTRSGKIRFPDKNIAMADVKIFTTGGEDLYFGGISEVMTRLYEGKKPTLKNRLIIIEAHDL
jgi:hypothetical protein